MSSDKESRGSDKSSDSVSGDNKRRVLDRSVWARLATNSGVLVVLVATVLAEALRVSFPLLSEFADVIGFTTAAGVVPVLFALTLLAAPLGAVAGLRVLLVVGVGGLALGRATMQVQQTPALVVTLVTVFTGFVALAVALRVAVARVGPLTTAAAFFLGFTVDTAIRLALTTWDAAWQQDVFPMVVGLALPVALLVVLGGALRGGGEATWGADGWQLGTVAGLALALETLILANPGYVAAASGAGLPTAGAIVLVGLGLAAATPALRGPPCWLAWVTLVAVAALLSGPSGLHGWLVPVGVLAGHVVLGALFATATVRAEMMRTMGRWRTGLGAGLGALALVATILPYQISYDMDALKAIPQFVWPTAAAVLVVVIVRAAPETADIRPPRVSRLRWAAALGPVPLLAVPAWLGMTWPSVELPAANGVDVEDDEEAQVRVATYNLHYSISEASRLDPEQQAQVLEAGGAEVILVQEVVRGWPIGGGLDAASWLSRRLGMEVVYGEAAESRFGNAVLARRPVLQSWSDTMARGEGPMRRGYVGATVRLGENTLDVWSTHLQHRDDTTATRQDQARQVLAAWGGAERTVIGGDFNAAPGEPDLEPWFDDTGLVSAEESAAESFTPTAPAEDPERKIDWLLGSPEVTFEDAEVVDTLASDHLPVFATVQVG